MCVRARGLVRLWGGSSRPRLLQQALQGRDFFLALFFQVPQILQDAFLLVLAAVIVFHGNVEDGLVLLLQAIQEFGVDFVQVDVLARSQSEVLFCDRVNLALEFEVILEVL